MNKLSLLLPALFALAGCAPTPTTQQPSVDVVSVTNKLTLTLSVKRYRLKRKLISLTLLLAEARYPT